MVETGLLDWAGVADRMSRAAGARSAGWPTTAGRSRSGEPANLTLVDPAAAWTVDPAQLASLSRNTPFAGRTLPARGRRDLAARPADGVCDGDTRDGRCMSSVTILVLEDGRTFAGEAYGAAGETFGEAVFATGMTGYQETLTDPSYHRQVVVQTAPHIGNTGVNDEDRRVAADLGRRLRRARPGPPGVQLARAAHRSTTSSPRRASSASAASTPAR